MARRRKERGNQERRRSARIMAMEEQKEKERMERIRKEEEEEEEVEEEVKEEEEVEEEVKEEEEVVVEEEEEEEEEKAKQEENDEMKSDVGENHLIYDSEAENSRAMKKGRKWKAFEEITTLSPPQPMQEGLYHGSGSSSRITGNATVEMNSNDFYMFPNDNSLFTSVLDSQSNFQLRYNENAGGGYRESLLRFVKGMGPVAQRVAMQKLENMEYMQPMKDELPDDHKPPTQADFNIKVEADADGDEGEDEVVSSPKGPRRI
ncbi:hypothetical protein Lal_00046307 [Lupinus albus]|uniref:Uncharacterized protein n=1 Tax=Lupinus albus TaxID=3870 RepID=A0A6A5NPM7_LUPAL|nr:hypothetical protein Lalb_Chr14g0370661 [Lupinus albus]KAF1887069.1 hypothetical protein Lal_00046307 [Lupinus albus]